MINRLFYISERIFEPGDEVTEDIHNSLLVFPANDGSLDNAYRLLGSGPYIDLVLTLGLSEPLSDRNIRSITSFLFIPSYLQQGGRPVINLVGESRDLLSKAASVLSDHLARQGFPDTLIHILSLAEEPISPGRAPFFRTPEEMASYYETALQTDPFYTGPVFFYDPSGKMSEGVRTILRQVESELTRQVPQWKALVEANRLLENKLNALLLKYSSTDSELRYQKEYVDVLRSDHAARELQDFYTKEYEILPMWYKRFGQVLKVLTGKRTFRSLFRDDVKKYKD